MKKILIIGGPDVNARIEFIEKFKNDYNFVCFGSSNSIKKDFDKSNIEYHYYHLNLNYNFLLDIISLFTLVKLIKVVSPTIVHTFDTKPSIIGRLAAKICSVPIIVGTLPGLGVLYTSEKKHIKLFRYLYEFLIRFICNLSNNTIFQNPDDRELFLNKGIVKDCNSSIILGSGIDTNYFSPDKINSSDIIKLKEEIGISKNDLIITMISRVIKSKGIQELANVSNKINDKRVRFLLIGEYNSTEKNTFSKYEFKLICENLIWLGFRSDIKNFIALSDIIVLPTYYREGIPRVLLEGASLKKPLISTNTPGCREIIVNGGNGYLIKPKDEEELKTSIMQLINDPVKRDKMGKYSRKLAVNNFDLLNVVNAHRDLYNSLNKFRNGQR